MQQPLEGVVPSPNAWHHPDVYEQEDRIVDPDGAIGTAVRRLLGPGGWEGLRVLDVGCGAGAALARFAARPGAAAEVVGVEPHPPLLEAARRRAAPLPGVQVLAGTAQALPLPEDSVDLAHARWAYFFGPGCEPGLAELERVLRPGGLAVVVDTDAARSTFGSWFRRGLPTHDPVAVERFWRRQGWRREELTVRWAAPDRAVFEAVVRIELPGPVADAVLAEHPGTEVDHALVLRWWRA